MRLGDAEMLRQLVLRDGPPPAVRPLHRRKGQPCPYRDKYPDGGCPWCAAQDRRETEGTPLRPACWQAGSPSGVDAA